MTSEDGRMKITRYAPSERQRAVLRAQEIGPTAAGDELNDSAGYDCVLAAPSAAEVVDRIGGCAARCQRGCRGRESVTTSCWLGKQADTEASPEASYQGLCCIGGHQSSGMCRYRGRGSRCHRVDRTGRKASPSAVDSETDSAQKPARKRIAKVYTPSERARLWSVLPARG